MLMVEITTRYTKAAPNIKSTLAFPKPSEISDLCQMSLQIKVKPTERMVMEELIIRTAIS